MDKNIKDTEAIVAKFGYDPDPDGAIQKDIEDAAARTGAYTPITGNQIGTTVTKELVDGINYTERTLTWNEMASLVIGCEETISNLRSRIVELKKLMNDTVSQAELRGWNREDGYANMNEETGDFRVRMADVHWSAEGLIEWDSI